MRVVLVPAGAVDMERLGMGNGQFDHVAAKY
ncbi:UNVERIFIED_ORG: 5-formyltetrahydrofolate cyclo-ligase [Arthrobacter sp. UYCu721]